MTRTTKRKEETQAETELRHNVLGYLVAINPRAAWMSTILDHFDGYGQTAVRKQVRRLIVDGLVKVYAGMYHASENGITTHQKAV